MGHQSRPDSRSMQRSAFAILLALLAAGYTEAQTCSTEKGDSCIFPFKTGRYQGNRLYTTCTTADGDAKPWCATAVDSNKYVTAWDYCNSECPGVAGASNMFVHPDNAVNNCKCGVPNAMAATRIVGGEEVQIGEYPWQVALLFSNTPASQGCGGTLVSDRHVITAAHCTAGSPPSAIKVLIGDTNLAVANDTQRFIVEVDEIKQHPDYSNVNNDIAVLVLRTPVDLYAYPNIKPACLPVTETVDDIIGDKAMVSGWGTVGSNEHLNGHLHEVTVEVYGKSNCGDHTSSMTDNMMCAGLMEGGKDSCQGDSGGPLVAKNNKDNNGAATLVGVVSWGFGCAAKNAPGVYADVAHFVKSGWLSSVLGSSMQTCPPPESSDWFPGSSSSGPIPTTTTTPSTPTSSVSTPPPIAVCQEEGYMPKKLVAYMRIPWVTDEQECSSLCQNDAECEYWAWKVKNNFQCRLYKVEMKRNINFISGPKFCTQEPELDVYDISDFYG